MISSSALLYDYSSHGIRSVSEVPHLKGRQLHIASTLDRGLTLLTDLVRAIAARNYVRSFFSQWALNMTRS